MGYDKYKDSNGVTWTITPSDNLVATGGLSLTRLAEYQWKMLAYVADEAEVGYEPKAPDLVATMPAFLPGTTATAEQTRNVFVDLTTKIEQWARDHRQHVTLRVTASPNGAGWLIVAALVIYAMSQGSRRR